MSVNERTVAAHRFLNWIQSLLILAGMAALLALLGWLIWGVSGIVLSVVVGVSVLMIGPSVSPYLILRLYSAQQVNHHDSAVLVELVQALAFRAGLDEAPRLTISPARPLTHLQWVAVTRQPLR